MDIIQFVFISVYIQLNQKPKSPCFKQGQGKRPGFEGYRPRIQNCRGCCCQTPSPWNRPHAKSVIVVWNYNFAFPLFFFSFFFPTASHTKKKFHNEKSPKASRLAKRISCTLMQRWRTGGPSVFSLSMSARSRSTRWMATCGPLTLHLW